MSARLAPYRIVTRHFVQCRTCYQEFETMQPKPPFTPQATAWLTRHCGDCGLQDACECDEPMPCGTAHGESGSKFATSDEDRKIEPGLA